MATTGSTERPISRLAPVDLAAAPDDVQKLVDAHHGEHWIQVLAGNPDTARRFAGYFGSLFAARGTRLPLEERELIAVVVSATNGCGLCEIHHTHGLGEVLGDHAQARRVALDHHLAELTPRQHAIVAFAEKLTRAPKSLGPADLDALRAVGLDDQDLIEVVETSAWFNHTNRIFIALGVLPDAKFFD